ncbi:MAG: tetratricopeptide repeat protein [Iodobacter sp.]
MKTLSRYSMAMLAVLLLAAASIAGKEYRQNRHSHALATPDDTVQKLRLAGDASQLQALAEAGHPLAARLLGEQSDDKKRATAWFEKAAEAGDQTARYRLGLASLKGEGMPQDVAKARLWFSTAGQQGLFRLGMMTLKGEGGPKDSTRGIEMVQQAAKNKDPAALYTLANWYRYGEQLPQNQQAALAYYKKAANLQYVPALQELSLAFEMGDLGLNIDPMQAHALGEMAGHISHCKQDHLNEIKLFD